MNRKLKKSGFYWIKNKKPLNPWWGTKPEVAFIHAAEDDVQLTGYDSDEETRLKMADVKILSARLPEPKARRKRSKQGGR